MTSSARRGVRRHAASLLTAAVLLSVSACSPILSNHGYAPRGDELNRITAGVDTRDSVAAKIGRPSTVGTFDDADWFYIAVESETLAFFEPEITDQRVVVVSFGEEGRVTEVSQYGLEDGRIIDLVSRTTPTSGRKLTILQQIFQNVGKYNKGRSLLRQRSGN